MRLSLIKDAEERLAAIEKEYIQTKINSDYLNNIQKSMHAPTKTKNALQSEFLSSDSRNLSSVGKLTPRSKYYKQQLYREELEKQILEAKERKKAEKDSHALLDVIKEPPSFFSQKDSPTGDIPTNYVLHYCQPLSGYNNYSPYGQNELPNSATSVLLTSASATKLDNSHLGPDEFLADTTQQCVDSQHSKKALYAHELRQQIEEARRKKEQQKRKDEEFDKKIEEESSKYDPFEPKFKQSLVRQAVTESEQKPHNGEDSFARGGHGIFGSPLTTEQKVSLQKYKEDLAQQIAEKRRAAEAQKQRELELERKDAERLAADQLRMQKEYEEEQARIKAKQEEAQRFAEQQRQEAELRKKTKLEQLGKLQAKATDGDLTSNNKTNNTSKRETKPKKQKGRLKSPELLIGPERATTCDHSGDKTVGQESNSIISQLRNLRSQLDFEKQKIENALTQSKTKNVWSNPTIIETARMRPKVTRKGSDLFIKKKTLIDKSYLYTETPSISSWAAEMMKEENRARMEHKQASYLRAQDSYLAELKEDLDLLSLREMRNDIKLRKLLKENDDEQAESTSESSFIELNEKPSKLTPRAASTSSISIEELAAKNDQRLKRLDAMQLLNDIDADPEAVLQRFIEKHEDTHAINPRFPCY